MEEHAAAGQTQAAEGSSADVQPSGLLAVSSFSIRVPHGTHILGIAPKKFGEDVSRYRDAMELYPHLSEAFVGSASTDPAFAVGTVGTPLVGSVSAVMTDIPAFLRQRHETPATIPSAVAFSVDDLTLPPQFSTMMHDAFERSSWRPQLISRAAFDGRRPRRWQTHDGRTLVNANDTFVSEIAPDESHQPEIELQRYLAAAMGQRRTYLFTASLATRIHNVVLPIGRLYEQRRSNPSPSYLVAPIVTLIRSAARRGFRRTVTVTLVLLPIANGSSNSAAWRVGWPSQLDMDRDIIDITAQWDWSPARKRLQAQNLRLEGSLRSYLASQLPQEDFSIDFTLRSLAETLLVLVGQLVSNDPERSKRDLIESEALQSLHIAKTSILLPWVDEGDPATANRDAEAIASPMANLLFTTVRSPLRTNLLSEMALPESPIPEGRFVASYYVAQHATLIYAYVKTGEESQKRSPIWMLAYLSYLGIALSAVRSSLLGLHREVDRIGEIPRQLGETAETMVELEEVFDLEFAVKTHRSYYEVMRERDGTLTDYGVLLSKVALLRDEATVRRQHQENVRVIIASAAIAALTAALAIPPTVDLILDSQTHHAARVQWGVFTAAITAALATTLILFVLWNVLRGPLRSARMRYVQRRSTSTWTSWRRSQRTQNPRL